MRTCRKLFFTFVMHSVCSLKDRGGNTGDPDEEGGPAKGEGRSEEKPGAECC